jgi:AcrR family transcriptional regulator
MNARAGLDRKKIVQAAAALADEDGLNTLSMAALASRLGVRAPTLYHYFDGLNGLKSALSIAALEDLSARLGRAVMGKAGDEAVLSLAHSLRSFAHEHPGLYDAVQRAPDDTDPAWQAAGQETVEIMVRALSAYELTQDDALHAVRMLRSIVHGFVSLELHGGFGLPLDVDETFRRLLAALLAYLHGTDR